MKKRTRKNLVDKSGADLQKYKDFPRFNAFVEEVKKS